MVNKIIRSEKQRQGTVTKGAWFLNFIRRFFILFELVAAFIKYDIRFWLEKKNKAFSRPLSL